MKAATHRRNQGRRGADKRNKTKRANSSIKAKDSRIDTILAFDVTSANHA